MTSGNETTLRHPTDSLVVDRILKGSPAWFALLVQRHGIGAFRTAYRLLGDWHAAEDVCQEALIDSFSRLSQLRDRAKYKQWLQSITRNRCRMAQRSTKPVRGETDFELFEDTKYPSAEDTLSRIEVTEIISELCNHLSRSEAPVARMYYLNGYGNEEIANRLGITTAAVDSRLHKARKRLHFMFEGSGRDNKTDRLIHHLIQHMKERYVMDTIRVELSRELLELVKPSEENPKLLGLIRDLREDIRRSSGVTIPRVHVIDNLALPENTYEIYLQGAKAGNGLVEDAHEPSALLSALRDAMNRYKDSLDP